MSQVAHRSRRSLGEEVPSQKTGPYEQRVVAGFEAENVGEDQRQNYQRQKRVEHRPSDTQNSALVASFHRPPDKLNDELAIAKDFHQLLNRSGLPERGIVGGSY